MTDFCRDIEAMQVRALNRIMVIMVEADDAAVEGLVYS